MVLTSALLVRTMSMVHVEQLDFKPVAILMGLLFAQTGLLMPAVVDRPLQLLGNAFGPLALVLVGVTLTNVRVGEQLRGSGAHWA